MNEKPQQESLYVAKQDHQLHLRHIFQQGGGTPILMLHGAIENGRIFYTDSGKGLGCYLAKQGFDVYVADLRGRGLSTPNINESSNFGQTEVITEDIPSCIDYIYERTGTNMHVVSHSWGGVLLASTLARLPQYTDKVRTNVCFGTKRSIKAMNAERLFKVDIVWNRLAMKLAKRRGYLDAVKWKMGSDNETVESLASSVEWVKPGKWIDPKDTFDYGEAVRSVTWPPTWHIAAIKDRVLGHPDDVKRFICETGNQDAKFTLLARRNGNLMNYDHINMLTHPKAVNDHFPLLSKWLHIH